MNLALLSNCTDGPYVATVVGRLGWAGIFDPFVVSSDIGYRKPLPEAFQPIVHSWPFEPAEIVMIGDSLYHDVAGAQRLGMQRRFTSPRSRIRAIPRIAPTIRPAGPSLHTRSCGTCWGSCWTSAGPLR